MHSFQWRVIYLLTSLINHSYALQLLTPSSILAGLSGRTQIELEDIGEMNELFIDAKTSAGMIEERDGLAV